MTVSPEEEARKALRAHQEAAGITFEDPDAPVAPDAKSIAMAEDEEIDGRYLGQN